MVEKQSKFSRRAIALFWLLLVGLVIGILIYFEQLALLYVLATVSLVALLVTVAFADLEKVGTENVSNFGSREESL
jgi:heme A synthase